MSKFLKPVWYWRCEFCKAESPVRYDQAGIEIQPERCFNPVCRKRFWLTGKAPAMPAVASEPAKRLKRTSDSARVWFYNGRHSRECPCVKCQRRFGRGLPPAEEVNSPA